MSGILSPPSLSLIVVVIGKRNYDQLIVTLCFTIDAFERLDSDFVVRFYMVGNTKATVLPLAV